MICAMLLSIILFVSSIYCRHKPRRSDLSKECFRDFEHCSIYPVPFVAVLVRVNMTWLLGNTRRQNQLLCPLMYASFLFP